MTRATLCLLATAIASLTPASYDGRRVLVRLYPHDRAQWASDGSEDDIALFVDFLRFAGRIQPGDA